MQPLFILTCMRSYSSVVSAMLGQHPQMYGLPELNPFLADTLGGIIQKLQNSRPQGLSGLLRTVAELEYQEQTAKTVHQAHAWFAKHAHWPMHDFFAYLGKKVGARILIEKSPTTAIDERRLAQLHHQFPDACCLHLVRHPRPTCASICELQQKTSILTSRRAGIPADPEQLWLRINSNILRFTAQLPPDRTLVIQGEQLLSQPELYLPQITEWLDLRTDAIAIAAMQHPEQSPYACLGPPNAPFGHDPNFLNHPHFEKRPTKAFRLEGPLEWQPPGNSGFSKATIKVARMLGYQ